MINKKKIRIAEITSIHPISDTRINRYKKYLISLNFEVNIFSANSEFLNKIIEQNRSTYFYLPYLLIRFFLLSKCLLHMTFTEAEILHVHDPELTLPCALICYLRKKKAILDIHELYTKINFWKIYFLCASKVLNTSIFISAGKDIKKELKEKLNIRSYTIDNFPLKNEYRVLSKNNSKNDENTSFKKEKNIFKIFFSAGYGSKRCINTFLESLKHIENTINYQVIVCGKGFEEYKRNHNIEKDSRIIFRGKLEHINCLEICKTADVSVILFTDEYNHYSVRSNRLFESINQGTPVIVANFGEWLNFIKKYPVGVLVDPKSPKDISFGLKKIHKDKSKVKSFSTNCKNIKGGFVWEKRNNHLINILNKLLK